MMYPMRQPGHEMQRSKYLALSYLALLSVTCLIPSLTAQPSGSGSSTSPSFRRRPPLLKRKLQSWMIRHQSHAKSASRMDSRFQSRNAATASSSSQPTGSILTFQRPTKERIFRWFGIEGEDPNQFLRCMMVRKEYNHHMVGITNPFLHIGNIHSYEESLQLLSPTIENTNQESDLLLHEYCSENGPSTQQANNSRKALPALRVQTAEKSWWPPLQIPPNKQRHGNKEWKIRKQLLPFRRVGEDWKILVYRKHVGRGMACYQRVRDAALDWNFESDDGAMGILEVPVTCPSNRGSAGVLQPYVGTVVGRYSVRPVMAEDPTGTGNSCVYRSLGSSSRRFVTFASNFMTGYKRRLYAVNPVMVVYDLVDQRAPGTTFTSTAYATLKGHWLQGEERVTVALRDGSEEVDVEILSISRAGPSLWGKAIWPFVGDMQTKFFEQHLDHLARTAGATVMNASDDESLTASRLVPKNVPSSAGAGCTTAKSNLWPFTPSSSLQMVNNIQP
jgi:uncharacterized protein (UPF0548 family)